MSELLSDEQIFRDHRVNQSGAFLKVLLLSPHYPPDVAATGQLVAELAHDLVAAGHQAVVVAARPSYAGSPAEPTSAWALATEQRNGVEIRWLPVPRWGRRTVWGRLLPFAGYAALAAPVAALMKDVDVVYALSTPPFLSALVATALARVRRIPFVYNLQDVYPEIAIALDVVQPGLVSLVAAKLERWLRLRADAITVIGEDMRAVVLRATPDVRELRVIPNWVDTELVTPVPTAQNAFRKQHVLQDKFVVLYSGNLGMVHGAELLPAVAQALHDLPNVRLVIVGEGPAKPSILAEVQRLGLKNVVLLPYQPKEQLAQSLSAADVSLVFQRPETLGLVVPSKLYGILASGRAVVAAVPEGSEAARVVREANAGRVVAPLDAPAVAQAVRELYVHKATRTAMGRRGRAAACEHFDRRQVTAQYRSLFEELVGRAARRRMTNR